MNLDFAIIETLGRQYKISVGDKIKVDRVSHQKQEAVSGTKITFTNVLCLASRNGQEFTVGNPYVKDATVIGKIVEQGQEKKGVAFKMKRRKGYRRKIGFRRPFTTVEIEGIKYGT